MNDKSKELIQTFFKNLSESEQQIMPLINTKAKERRQFVKNFWHLCSSKIFPFVGTDLVDELCESTSTKKDSINISCDYLSGSSVPIDTTINIKMGDISCESSFFRLDPQTNFVVGPGGKIYEIENVTEEVIVSEFLFVLNEQYNEKFKKIYEDLVKNSVYYREI